MATTAALTPFLCAIACNLARRCWFKALDQHAAPPLRSGTVPHNVPSPKVAQAHTFVFASDRCSSLQCVVPSHTARVGTANEHCGEQWEGGVQLCCTAQAWISTNLATVKFEVPQALIFPDKTKPCMFSTIVDTLGKRTGSSRCNKYTSK